MDRSITTVSVFACMLYVDAIPLKRDSWSADVMNVSLYTMVDIVVDATVDDKTIMRLSH